MTENIAQIRQIMRRDFTTLIEDYDQSKSKIIESQ